MLFWIIRQIIISFIFIFTAHYIYIYFKKILSLSKIKDLIKNLLNSMKKYIKQMKKRKTLIKKQ